MVKKSDKRGSEGGRKRAKVLGPQRRKEIASAAAKAKWDKVEQAQKDDDIPSVIRTGTLTIGNVILPVAVLSDKTRVITEKSVAEQLGRGYGGKSKKLAQSSKTSGPPLPKFLSGSTVEPFISDSLRVALSKPILYKARGGVRTAVNANLLREICEAWIKAKEAKALQPSQKHIADNAATLLKGLTDVGIYALIDEVTGYQEIRDRDELQRILEAYVSDVFLPWTKHFPDEYYEQLFRLKGWQYSPPSVKRPKMLSQLTATLIYGKLPTGVLEELRIKNPKTPKGYRKNKHFMFLTEDLGNPHLEKQIVAVTTLMRASPNWSTFMRLFNNAFPINKAQPILPGFEDKIDDDVLLLP